MYQKGYQMFENVSSAVTTKIKGLGYTFTQDGVTEIRYLSGKLRVKTTTKGDYRVIDVRFFFI